ncbi:MAG: uroporphyrinogen-III synthase [Novosphingobium sp.]|uniref:uroporphyrinogen-III synthase n=1 Tax=Novosphingobium sp. TaxID=1874826 RepID=UPI003C7EBEA6
MVPLIVIRPQPGNAATVAAAISLRMTAHGFALFDMVPKSWEAALPGRHDALLIGSAQVFRLGGAGLSGLRDLPVYAVGEATAEAARAARFTVAATGEGAMQALFERLDPAHRRLLRLTGEERVALQVPKGITVDERVVYASRAAPLPAELAELLAEPAIVALHSAEAARHLTAQCVTHGIKRARLRLAALSQRIAAAAGDGWGEVAVAAFPEDKALLVLARQMCQDPWPAGRISGN